MIFRGRKKIYDNVKIAKKLQRIFIISIRHNFQKILQLIRTTV